MSTIGDKGWAMAEAVCSALTLRGEPCRAPVMAGGKCRHHGGVELAQLLDGFYANALEPGERQLYRSAAVGSLDEEIRWAKVRLFRLAQMQQEGAQLAGLDALLDRQLEMIRKLELARVDLLKAGAGQLTEDGPVRIEVEVVGCETSN